MTREHLTGIGGTAFLDEDRGVRLRRFTGGRGAVRSAEASISAGRPERVCDPEGRRGWRLRLPERRPLATPAVRGGRVFLGGGFGSHEVFAFHGESGEHVWRLRTKDDGPTAATAAGDFVAFNTESCTVHVVEAETGRVVWERWLGDPLMAQPAVHGSRLFMAYPDRGRRHVLAAFDLPTGAPLWQTELIGDVITAPIVAEGSLYATALDGTVYRIDPETGTRLWSIGHRATSAPWIHRGRIFVSLREDGERAAGRSIVEGYDTVCLMTGFRPQRATSGRRYASYLAQEKPGATDTWYASLDAAVGFGATPSSAKLDEAYGHIGLRHVSAAWSFQGSRPEAFDDGVFGVLGDTIQKLDLASKQPLWRCRLQCDAPPVNGMVLSPPAVTAGRLYMTSAFGDLFVLDRETGDELWALNVGSAIVSQPAVADGRVYFGTVEGTLYSFEAGDDGDAGGWPMWGGGPGHNGSE